MNKSRSINNPGDTYDWVGNKHYMKYRLYEILENHNGYTPFTTIEVKSLIDHLDKQDVANIFMSLGFSPIVQWKRILFPEGSPVKVDGDTQATVIKPTKQKSAKKVKEEKIQAASTSMFDLGEYKATEQKKEY